MSAGVSGVCGDCQVRDEIEHCANLGCFLVAIASSTSQTVALRLVDIEKEMLYVCMH